jgi:hypothetical protein
MYDGKSGYDESDVDFANRPPDFEMLFDLSADPEEVNNLIETHADNEMLAALRQRCAAQSQAINERRQAFKQAVKVQRR